MVRLTSMADDMDTLIGLMPFATEVGITLIEASPAGLGWRRAGQGGR